MTVPVAPCLHAVPPGVGDCLTVHQGLEAIIVNRSMRPVGATIALAGLLMLGACTAGTAPTPPTVGAATSPAAATVVVAASPGLDQFVRAFRLGRQAPERGGQHDGGVGESM
jgi:hypothetical protein